MRELGDDAQSLHEQAGRRAKEAGIARLYALGALSAAGADAFGEGGRKFDTHEALAEALRADIAAFLGTDFAAGASAASPSGGGEKLAAEAAPTGADRSEEHTSELQSLMRISYAVFCLQKKQKTST